MAAGRRKAKSEHWEARRNELLLAAGSLFIRKGYAGTSMADIARVCKVDKATLYYYFSKKMSILYEIATGAIKGITAVAVPIAESARPPDEKLRLLVEEHIKWQISHLGIGGMGVIERANLSPKLLRNYVEMRDAYEGIFLKVLEEGMRQGHFRRTDPKVASIFTLGFVNSVVQWFKAGGKLTADQIASEAAEFVCKALSPGPASGTVGHLSLDMAATASR